MNLYKKFEKKFYMGPDWIERPAFLTYNKSNYKSPTILLLLWGYALYLRILTIPGRMILASMLLLFLYSAVIIDSPIRLFTFILIGIIAIDVIVGFIFRPKLLISRKIPERTRANNPIKIEYTIKNLRSIPLWNLHIDPIYKTSWLKLESDIASIDLIKGGETAEIAPLLKSYKRGEYVLKPPFISSAFPFEIIKWSCRTKTSQKLKVYPAFETLNSLALPINSKFQKEGMALVSNVGESLEFHGCRDFRTGDNTKHIHWPTTARRGEIIVKEYQEEYLSRIAIIVDTYIPKNKNFFTLKHEATFPTFEATLSLTASLAHYLAKGDYIIDIFAAGPNIYHFKGGRSLAQLDQILDILASIEPNREQLDSQEAKIKKALHQKTQSTPFMGLNDEVIDGISSIGSAMLLLLKWDKPRAELVNQLQMNGVALKVIIVTDEKENLENLPNDAQLLTANEIFKGHIRDL